MARRLRWASGRKGYAEFPNNGGLSPDEIRRNARWLEREYKRAIYMALQRYAPLRDAYLRSAGMFRVRVRYANGRLRVVMSDFDKDILTEGRTRGSGGYDNYWRAVDRGHEPYPPPQFPHSRVGFVQLPDGEWRKLLYHKRMTAEYGGMSVDDPAAAAPFKGNRKRLSKRARAQMMRNSVYHWYYRKRVPKGPWQHGYTEQEVPLGVTPYGYSKVDAEDLDGVSAVRIMHTSPAAEGKFFMRMVFRSATRTVERRARGKHLKMVAAHDYWDGARLIGGVTAKRRSGTMKAKKAPATTYNGYRGSSAGDMDAFEQNVRDYLDEGGWERIGGRSLFDMSDDDASPF